MPRLMASVLQLHSASVGIVRGQRLVTITTKSSWGWIILASFAADHDWRLADDTTVRGNTLSFTVDQIYWSSSVTISVDIRRVNHLVSWICVITPEEYDSGPASGRRIDQSLSHVSNCWFLKRSIVLPVSTYRWHGTQWIIDTRRLPAVFWTSAGSLLATLFTAMRHLTSGEWRQNVVAVWWI